MARAGKQVGQLGLLAAAFLAGRWTHSVGTGSPQAELSDVAPEERHLLYTPPPGHGAVEVSTTTTSVLRDARGEIHNLRIGAARFNVLASLAGAMRSGDVHRSRQLDMVFSGLCTVTTREAGRDVRRTYGAGSLIELPAHVPHSFEFLNDTVMAEWWPDVAPTLTLSVTLTLSLHPSPHPHPHPHPHVNPHPSPHPNPHPSPHPHPEPQP